MEPSTLRKLTRIRCCKKKIRKRLAKGLYQLLKIQETTDLAYKFRHRNLVKANINALSTILCIVKGCYIENGQHWYWLETIEAKYTYKQFEILTLEESHIQLAYPALLNFLKY